jgi:hypothetical protein
MVDGRVNDGERRQTTKAESCKKITQRGGIEDHHRLPPACLPATAFTVHEMQSVVTFVSENFVLTFIG